MLHLIRNHRISEIMRNLYIILMFRLVFSGNNFHLGKSKGDNLGLPVKHYQDELPKALWFKQKLDHFSPADLTIWRQKYYVNSSFFDFANPGPVFLMIGGEGPANPLWMVKGAWIEYAQKFQALCINLEHRYYGESFPTRDLSTKNLAYLTSHQALADLANFIKAMNDRYHFNNDVKWIAFGGSYPGSLAAWLRLKYPHLVYAAVSSSGPLLAKVNFVEYFQVVVNALTEKTGSDECVNRVKEAHGQIVSLMQTRPEIIAKEFRVCTPFSSATADDMKNFYNTLADNFAELVQYNEDKRITNNNDYTNITINTVCNLLTEPGSTSAYERLALFNSIMLSKSNTSCLDYNYKDMIKQLRNVSLTATAGRQWMYQTCSEFGFYQTSSGEIEVFGNNFTLDFFIQQCQDVFGSKFNNNFVEMAVEWTNDAYGGLDISTSRVVFVHGSVDPWHALGITQTKDNDAPVIYIQGTAHCANMYPSYESDSESLKEARVEIEEYLNGWISSVHIPAH